MKTFALFALFAHGKTRMMAIKDIPIQLGNSLLNLNTLGKFTS